MSKEKAIKTIKFLGTKDHYPVWEFQMRVFLEELECITALNRVNCGTSLTADDNERIRKAYMKLALACDDTVSFQLVKRSTSSDYPHGDATAAWTALQNRWAPKKEIDKQTALTKLFSMKLEDVNMDPEIWIIELQRMQVKLEKMGEKVSDGLLMAHILANLPREYENVADQLARDTNKSVKTVCDELKQKYERMKKSGEIENDQEEDTEKVLVGYKKYNGNFNNCGKKGRKTADCYFKNKEKSNGGQKGK
jgi:hypothetical protein